MSDRIKTTPDVPWREPGVGLYVTFGCMGCAANTARPQVREVTEYGDGAASAWRRNALRRSV